MLSRFDFVKALGGFKPRQVYLLLSRTGSGKSTLLNALVCDASKSTRISFFASEEYEDQVRDNLTDRESANLENIDIISERLFVRDNEDISTKDYFDWLRGKLVAFESKFLVFDNLTTSNAYITKSPKEQVLFYEQFAAVAYDLEIPVFIVAHVTDKANLNPGLLSPDDISYSKQPAKKAENVITLEKVLSLVGGETEMFTLVRLAKNRFGTVNRIFRLYWNNSARIYTSDSERNFIQVKSILDSRLRM